MDSPGYDKPLIVPAIRTSRRSHREGQIACPLQLVVGGWSGRLFMVGAVSVGPGEK